MPATLRVSPDCPERLLSERLRYAAGGTEMSLSSKSRAAQQAVRRKIDEGVYRFEETACFCGRSDGPTVATRDRYGLWYPIVLCPSCGLLRANPRMDRASYVDFYKNDYRALYGDEDVEFDRLCAQRLEQGRAVHAFIRRHVGERLPVVLDVGCNLGTMLLPFADEGSEVFGVDFGVEYLRRGRERTGLKNLIEGDVDAFLKLGRKADLIICSHSVEHFLDLERELGRLREALAPGGRLFIDVPGTRHVTERLENGNFLGLLQNAHTWQFDNETLDYVLECCGFRKVLADDRIRSIYEVAPRRRAKSDLPPGAAARVDAYLRALERRYLPRWYAKKALEALGLKKALKRMPGR